MGGPDHLLGRCTGLAGMSGADLLSLDAPNDIVRCDEVGLDVRGAVDGDLNVLISLGLAAIWIKALRTPAN